MDKSLNRRLKEKLLLIHSFLNKKDLRVGPSLMNGDIGILLFNVNFEKYYSKGESNPSITNKIDELFREFEEGNLPLSFSNGLSGFCWFLEYVKNNSLTSKQYDTRYLFKRTDDLLYESMKIEINKGNYDYLHGALGVGLYFLEVNDSPISVTYVKELIWKLENLPVFNSNGSLMWHSYSFFEDNGQFNGGKLNTGYVDLSISHGLASIIAFLVFCIKKGICIDKCRSLIKSSSLFLIDAIQLSETNNEILGYSIIGDYEGPAWCYGKLSVNIALLKAFGVLNEREKYNIILKRLKELPHDISKLPKNYDSCFCHGASGIAFMYDYLYKLTNDKVFLEYSNMWYEKLLSIAIFDNGIAGYMTYGGNSTMEEAQWYNAYGLIDGISGIGLSILGRLKKEHEWSSVFMI